MKLLNGTFIALICTCTVLGENCGFPGSPRNGNISVTKEAYLPGSRVDYSCKKRHYEISGHQWRTCLDNGTWTGSVPFCLTIFGLDRLSNRSMHMKEKCYNPNRGIWCQIDIFVTPRHERGARVKTIRLQLSGSRRQQLNVSVMPHSLSIKGECERQIIGWNQVQTFKCATPPHTAEKTVIEVKGRRRFEVEQISVLLKNVHDCGIPEAPSNGIVKVNNLVATYACRDEYDISGYAKRKCETNGTWSGSPPFCRAHQEHQNNKTTTTADDRLIGSSVQTDDADDINELIKNVQWGDIASNDVQQIGKKLQRMAFERQKFSHLILAPLANLTDKLLDVSQSVIQESKTNIPDTIETILSNIDVRNTGEVRVKMKNIEINIWNVDYQDIPLVCGYQGFSKTSLFLNSSAECPVNSREYSVRIPGNVSGGNAILSIFKGQSLFPKGSYSYQYVIQAKLSSNPQPKDNATPAIEIQFKKPQHSEVANCSFLDMTNSGNQSNKWSSEGCWISSQDDVSVICQCNHFTHFAALFHAPVPVSLVKVFHMTTFVGVSLSIVCLFLTFFTYIVLPKLRSRTNHILFHLCIAMLLMDILFVVNINETEDNIKCYFTAFTLHVSVLATFVWLLMVTIVVALSLWKGTSAIFIIDKYSIKASIVSWLAPILVAALTVCVDSSVYTTNSNVCWLTEQGFIYAFLPFYGLLTGANCLLWLAIFVKVGHFMNLKSSNNEVTTKLIFQICMSFLLFLFTNLMWILGICAYAIQNSMLSILFCVVAPGQGIFIFVFYVAIDSKGKLVWSTIVNMLQLQCCRKSARKGSSTQDTPLSFATGSRIT